MVSNAGQPGRRIDVLFVRSPACQSTMKFVGIPGRNRPAVPAKDHTDLFYRTHITELFPDTPFGILLQKRDGGDVVLSPHCLRRSCFSNSCCAGESECCNYDATGMCQAAGKRWIAVLPVHFGRDRPSHPVCFPLIRAAHRRLSPMWYPDQENDGHGNRVHTRALLPRRRSTDAPGVVISRCPAGQADFMRKPGQESEIALRH